MAEDAGEPIQIPAPRDVAHGEAVPESVGVRLDGYSLWSWLERGANSTATRDSAFSSCGVEYAGT